MKKICVSFLAAWSIALVLVVPAFAEYNNMNRNDMNTNNVNTNSYHTNATTQDKRTDWGWLGLLGLVGLAGLKRRSPERQ
ncbi:WGxxGxxG family protein [Paenibacillus solani]|uniref:WGxxGxxG family protein n=1 Tax=Paenibacillus solani TaxID=1705565 RepID=UPI003D2793BF